MYGISKKPQNQQNLHLNLVLLFYALKTSLILLTPKKICSLSKNLPFSLLQTKPSYSSFNHQSTALLKIIYFD
ncbi:transmembrane protein, putative (macronuclear) [Tetrahymena thermophila SB210]|uniref:Transmembrane protein, putative n=1 Tax=Tetrahymena thermophila (strain SB210) TaxID=312017 RepID=Q234S3_TETTS|nr:transmembrane protein, putative [Tetrahymena thermophila SB210]EAR91930.1 transmembrane protein, putative [Tetrahymena thermophila SB210]|eukprot:XP_001012175.1 transmembrane protein, putative [Tetrahymena thermophila SB210]